MPFNVHQRKEQDMFKRVMVVVALVLCCAVTAAAETPKEGAAEILKLLADKNYTELFPARYTEWYKTEEDGAEPEVAVEKLAGMWEKNYAMMTELFTQLTEADFVITQDEQHQKTETGDVATATVTIGGQEVPYRLFKMNNGLWGFHL
jgi:hypothetical protein